MCDIFKTNVTFIAKNKRNEPSYCNLFQNKQTCVYVRIIR